MDFVLTHSYIFIDKSNITHLKLSECKSKLLNDNNILLGLLNIPTNNTLYKIHILENKSKLYNIKIQIEIDYLKLVNYIKKKTKIPNKNELFFLLKKNFIKPELNNTNINDKINKISYKKLNLKSSFFYKKDFIKFKDLVFDILNENIYFENEIDNKIYGESYIFNIIKSYPNINILKQIIKYINNSTILLYNYDNKKLINTYLSSMKNRNNLSTIIIGNVLKETYKKNNYETLIIFDIENLPNYIQQIKEKIEFKNIIVINQKYEINKLEYLNLIENKCLYNQEQFKNSFINIKNTNIIFSKKILKKYKQIDFTKDYIKNLTTKNKNLYNSLEENIINLNNISLKSKTLSEYKNNKCSICLDKFKLPKLISTNCNHLYCDTCLFKNFLVSNKCPQCRQIINTNNLYKNNSKYSSKIVYINTNLEFNKKLLVISYFKESLHTLQKIFNNNKNLVLINIKNIINIKNYNNYDKILFLEDNYPDFDYYKYLFVDTKRKIEILS
jgi:hypothetical protein